jgi:hypothetical protein
VFENRDGRLVDRTEAAGLAETNGWWRSVRAADLTGDGTADLVAGNHGLNARIRATREAPARLYLNDFDENGQPDPILTVYRDGARHPFAGRDELIEQIPSLKEDFPTYESFGDSQIEDLVPAAKIEAAIVKDAHTFASSAFVAQGDGTFSVDPLPSRAQMTPVYGLLARDLVGDGARDLLLGGNFYGVKPRQGRYDASYGTLLRGTDSTWTPVPPPESNLYLTGQVRALRLLERGDSPPVVLVARNDARPQVVRLGPGATP